MFIKELPYRITMDFAERASMHMNIAEECESSAPNIAGSHRRLASILNDVADDIQKNEATLQSAVE